MTATVQPPRRLESYVCGGWAPGQKTGATLLDAATGAVTEDSETDDDADQGEDGEGTEGDDDDGGEEGEEGQEG